jgi:UDP-N-acetylglucosamine transferase subunit ALG13
VIFVTVGSQMPFRRLIQAVDEWAQANPEVEVLAQIGNDKSFQSVAVKTIDMVSPDRFAELILACELVVAHAGMGSVLTALELGKPMILMPRRGALHETRNDHQVATLRWLESKPGIYPAEDEVALKSALDDWLARGLTGPPTHGERPDSLQTLIETVRSFIA